MSNITITLNVNAPELCNAIISLASALGQPAAQQNKPALTLVPQPAQTEPVQPTTFVQTQTPAPVAAPAPANAVVPTTAQTYSMDQLAVAATQMVDAGRRIELVQLLGQFGVQALTALPKELYGNFATQLRAMGAKI